ncbi:hypothetical protein CRI67_15875 [Escherichia sp. E4702]|nr:hypothetical protein CRI67_15875 [Escherichia sp. E4702]
MKSEELMYGNKDYQKFRLTFLFKREKLIYILFALPEREVERKFVMFHGLCPATLIRRSRFFLRHIHR